MSSYVENVENSFFAVDFFSSQGGNRRVKVNNVCSLRSILTLNIPAYLSAPAPTNSDVIMKAVVLTPLRCLLEPPYKV